LQRRAADLVAYQGDRTAARLITLTQRAWDEEQTVTGRTDLSEAVLRNFFKLIAYKDEYEVARMLTDPAFLATVRAQVPGGENLTYKLHPPMLKALGREKKIGMGPRTHVVLRVLARARWLRGTPLDPFGHSHVRRTERRLVAHYERTIHDLLESLTPDSYERAVAIASAPDLIRGYEEVKIRNIAVYSARLMELGVESPELSLSP
jgi:indolepyruvate ferredoxin oxidoreductase